MSFGGKSKVLRRADHRGCVSDDVVGELANRGENLLRYVDDISNEPRRHLEGMS
jgi:hypothetical protein